MEEQCKHNWVEKQREKRVKDMKSPGWFTQGYIQYEMVILQECEKCGKYNVVVF